MNSDAYHNADNKADFHDNWVSQQEREEEKRKELLAKFANGMERYMNEPLFHSVFDSLARGSDPFKIIEQLIDVNKHLYDEITKLALR